MLGYMGYALASKLNATLNLGLAKIVVSSGEYLVNRMKAKEGRTEISTPAMSIMRTTTQRINNRIPRGPVGRYGISINPSDGYSTVLKLLPINVSYSVTIITSTLDDVDRVETALIWMFDDPAQRSIPIKLNIAGMEKIVDSYISDTSVFEATLTTTKQEEWEGYLIYKTTLEPVIETFLIKPDQRHLITSIDISYMNTNEIVFSTDTFTV